MFGVFSGGAAVLKGILGRSDTASHANQELGNRLSLDHQFQDAASTCPSVHLLRKEWRRYLKMQRAHSNSEDHLREFLEMFQRYQIESKLSKINIGSLLGRECGFCEEIVNHLQSYFAETNLSGIGIDALTLQPVEHLWTCLLLVTLLNLEWDKSTSKTIIESKLPSNVTRILHDRVDMIRNSGHDELHPVDEKLWELLARMMEHREFVEIFSEIGDPSLSMLMDICTTRSWGKRTIEFFRKFAIKTAAKLSYLLNSRADRLEGLASVLDLYIQSYGIVGRWIQRLNATLQAEQQEGDVVEILGKLIGLVIALGRFSLRLCDEFEAAHGYDLLQHLLFAVPCTASQEEFASAVLNIFTSLTLISDLDIPGGFTGAMGGVGACRGGILGLRVCNPRAFDALIGALLACESHVLRRMMLETAVDIYASHRENYHLLHGTDAHFQENGGYSCRGMAAILDRLGDLEEDLAETALQTVLHLITVLGCRPYQELRAIGRLLARGPSLQVQMIICRCLKEVVMYDASFRDVLRDQGILETLVQVVVRNYALSQPQDPQQLDGAYATKGADPGPVAEELGTDEEPKAAQDYVKILMIEALTVVVNGHRQNARLVREKGLPCLLQLVWNDTLHSASLGLLGCLARSGTDDDAEACVAGLCEMLQSAARDDTHRLLLTADVLATLLVIVEHNEAAKAALRLFGGFDIVLGVLERLQGCFRDPLEPHQACGAAAEENLERFTDKHAAKLFEECLSLLSVGTARSTANYHYLWTNIGFNRISKAVVGTNVFRSVFCDSAIQSIAGLASGGRAFDLLALPTRLWEDAGEDGALFEVWTGTSLEEMVAHSESVKDFLPVLAKQFWCAEPLMLLVNLAGGGGLPTTLAHRMLNFVTIVAASRPDHAQMLASAGILRSLRQMLLRRPHDGQLSRSIVDLVATVGCVWLDSRDANMLLRLCWRYPGEIRSLLVPALVKMASSGQSCSYLRFSLDNDCGHAAARVPIAVERVWPPPAGYTLVLWLYVEAFGDGPLQIFQLTAYSGAGMACEPYTITTYLNSTPACLSIQSSPSDVLTFSSFRLQVRAWYHVAIVHSHHRIHSSTAALYVNGLLREQGQLRSGQSLRAAMLNQVQGMLTTSVSRLSAAFGSVGLETTDRQYPAAWRLRSAMLVEEPLGADRIYQLFCAGQSLNRYQGSLAECQDSAVEQAAFLYKGVDSTDETEFFLASITSGAGQVALNRLLFIAHFEPPQCPPSRATEVTDSLVHVEWGRAGDVNNAGCGEEWRLEGAVAAMDCQTLGDAISGAGGMAAVLALLEQAESPKELSQLLQLVRRLLWGSVHNLCHMERLRGYEVLGRILQAKAGLLDSRGVLELLRLSGMGGTPSLAVLANPDACRYLLVDLQLWGGVDVGLHAQAMQGLASFLVGNVRRRFNAVQLRGVRLVPLVCLHLSRLLLSAGGVDGAVALLAAYMGMGLNQADLMELAGLILLCIKSCSERRRLPARGVDVSESGAASPFLGAPQQAGRMLAGLLGVLLGLVGRADDTETLEALAGVLDPGWLAAMLALAQDSGTVSSLVLVMAGLARSGKFVGKLRGSHALVLLGELLERHHASEGLFLAVLHLLLAAPTRSEPAMPPPSMDLHVLRKLFSQARLAFPEALPLVLRLLRANLRYEMALAEQLRAVPPPQDDLAGPPSPRFDAIAEEACSPLPHRSTCHSGVVCARLGQEEEEDVVELAGELVDILVDRACASPRPSPASPDSPASSASAGRPRSTLVARLEEASLLNSTAASFLLFLYDRDLAGRAEFSGHEVVESLVGLIFVANDAAEAEQAPGEDEGRLSRVRDEVLRRVGGLFRPSDSRVSEEADGYGREHGADPGGEETGDGGPGGSEVLSSCSLHDKSCSLSTAAGEVVFQLLSRVTEEALRTQAKGIGVVYVALEAVPLSTAGATARGFAGRLLSSLSKYLYVASVELDVLGDLQLARNLEQFCELVVDIMCAESYPVAHSSPLDFVIMVMDKMLQAEQTTQHFPVLAARHLGTLHRTANRLALHLLLRLQHHPERLQAVVTALADKAGVVFSGYNNEEHTLVLIGHALFTLFFHEAREVRRASMRLWGHLLATKKPFMLALLSYTGPDGASRNLFHDGFEKLLPPPADIASGEAGARGAEQALDRFTEWLAGGLQNGLLLDQQRWLREYRLACQSAPASTAPSPARPSLGAASVQAGGGVARVAAIASILAANARRHKAAVVSGAQKRLAGFLGQHQKNRAARRRRIAVQARQLQVQLGAAHESAAALLEAALRAWSAQQLRRLQKLESRAVFTDQTWFRRKVELSRERGVFAGRPLAGVLEPNAARPLWWRLDSTEGPLRMRRRLELDVEEMARPRWTWDPVAAVHRPVRDAFRATPAAAGRWEPRPEALEPPCTCARLRSEVEEAAGTGKGRGVGAVGLVSHLVRPDLGQRVMGTRDGGVGEGGIVDEDRLRWLLDPADALRAVFNCLRLSSGDAVPGVCVICSRHVYVIDHCLVAPSGEVSMFHPAPPGPALPRCRRAGPPVAAQAVRRWALGSIRDVQRRKYLLRPVGLEMFTSDGLNCLLIFHKAEREAALDRISDARAACSPPEAEAVGVTAGSACAGGGPSVAGAGEAAVDVTDATQAAELSGGGWTGSARSAQKLLQRLSRMWQAGEISNFQYLMHLNTLAGRSYNDITQYPVFPWVLADYTSEELDLSDPRAFRDLSKPMGAQDPTRAAEYRRRYDEWVETDPDHPTPRFHYATHYSSAPAVTFYLLRLEPFTSAHVRLQGGKLDHADRLFTSVAASWASASRSSLSDVKELVPEFFYLPDFLRNPNRLDISTPKLGGAGLGHVELPPWARGSPEEFVRRHRAALESEVVSANLHEWIDLIFGHKQRGPAAEAALNVFHHLSYEGAVDVDAVEDPVERMAAIAAILNFGQTPTQLFMRPHPPRQSCPSPARMLSGDGTSSWALDGPAQAVPVPVGGRGPARELMVGPDGRLMVARGLCSLNPAAPVESARWGYADGGLRLLLSRPERAGRVSAGGEGEKLVGAWGGMHMGGVACAAFSEDGTLLVTGGAGGDLGVWDVGRRTVRDGGRPWVSVRGLGRQRLPFTRGSPAAPPAAALGSGWVSLRERLCGHQGAVGCLAVCKKLGVVVSGAADGSVLLWDLLRLRFVRQLLAGLPAAPAGLSLTESGAAVLVCAGPDLHLLSLNGVPLARCSAPAGPAGNFTCATAVLAPDWAVAWPMVYTGHARGALCLWRLRPASPPNSLHQPPPLAAAEAQDDSLGVKRTATLHAHQETSGAGTGEQARQAPPTLAPAGEADWVESGENQSDGDPGEVSMQGCQSLQLELVATCPSPASAGLCCDSPVLSVAFGPDNKAVYTGDALGRVFRWDTGAQATTPRWRLSTSASFWL